MKKITAIVRPEKLEPLKDALFAAKVSGMTISQVQGCGSQHGWKEYYRGTEVLLNMVPKVKFEIICDDAEVDALIGDPGKAADRLGWVPTIDGKELAKLMVDADIKALENGPDWIDTVDLPTWSNAGMLGDRA